MISRRLKLVALTMVGFYSVIGVLFCAVFVAMQFGLLNVRGTIGERNKFFSTLDAHNTQAVLGAVSKSPSPTSCVAINPDGQLAATCGWNNNREWAVVREGLRKDASLINQVATETGVDSRMIAASVAPEQLRFFTSERESFKTFFEPLKVLGSMSQFSLGVSGIKQATANQIERNMKDTNSAFYAGSTYSTLITYPPGVNHDQKLYQRLTDSKNHYYAYLYTALFIKQVEAQWQKQGYDISKRPDVTVTLFNIGFAESKPKDNPKTGGTPITLSGTTYNFGELGTMFYLSGELTDVFPR